MKKVIVFFVLILSIIAFSEKYQNIAIDYLKYLYSKQFDKAINISNETMKSQLSEKKLKQTWETLENAYGIFQKIEKIDYTKNGEYEVYIITSKFEKTKLSVIISVDVNGKIAGLFFNQAKSYEYKIPNYADASKFKELDITLGEKWKLNGKLTVPNKNGKLTGVILIHGSGPSDMDETIGPNKPFKDLAYGLSSNGIVVLRYDKRTKVYRKQMNKITLNEEVFEDVSYAIEYLSKLNYIDNIYIIGHSLGGYLAPYIAKSNNNIKGIILMAAPGRNLEEITIDQLNYLKKFENEETQKVYDSLIEKLQKIKNNELDNNVNALGAPVYYYKELRNYLPTKYLPNLNLPILILHGKRDYQVTEKDFNILKQYAKKENLKLYDDLNHLFIKGKEESNPYEYYKEGHVDEKVIEDIVEWLQNN